jgi:hypothetical protein
VKVGSRSYYKHSPSRIHLVYRMENLTMANRAISLRSEFGRYQGIADIE